MELREKAATYHVVFTSESGKKVLDDLRGEFFCTPMRSTVYRDANGRVDEFGAIFNAGCREVVQHIEALIERHIHPERFQVKTQEPTTDEMMDLVK